MLFDNAVLVGFGVVVLIYVLFKFFNRKDDGSSEYENLYNKILTSDEHKVKGQHEK